MFLKQWLLNRRWILLLVALLISTAFLAYFVFSTTIDVALYMALLLGVISIPLLAIDAWKEYQRYLRIRHQLEAQTYSSLAEITLATAYQTVKQENAQLEQQQQKNYNELLDYYTLWAHQIKTPIAASQLLIGQLEESTTKTLLTQELFKIQQYAEFVLHYLRMETFHQDLVLQKASLLEIIQTVVKKYATFFIHKHITLELQDNLDQIIITDKKWFELLIEQLLSNAIKYTDSGKISFYVHEETLHITDTGIGIRSEDINRVFERGFTGYNGRVHQQSSGLGLYLSKQIATSLGHSITIESTVHVGTTVSISLKRETIIQE